MPSSDAARLHLLVSARHSHSMITLLSSVEQGLIFYRIGMVCAFDRESGVSKF